MTVDPVAWFLGGGTEHEAVHARRVLQGAMGSPVAAFTASESPTTGGGGHGVVGRGDFAVTAGTGLQTVVAAGQAFVLGSSETLQGCYQVVSSAAVNVTHPTADATHARIDLVVVRVRDDDYDGSGLYSASVAVVQGTPSSSPAAPAVPANSLVLARVAIPALAATVGTITDRRRFAAALGGMQFASALPSGAAAQTQRLVSINGRLWAWSERHDTWEIVGGHMPRIIIQRTSDITISESAPFQSISFSSGVVTTVDTDSFHTLGDQFVKIPAGLGGDYQLSWWARPTNDAAAFDEVAAYVSVNGSAVADDQRAWASSGQVAASTGTSVRTVSGSRLIRLRPGAELILQMWQKSSSNRAFQGGLSLHMVTHLPNLTA